MHICILSYDTPHLKTSQVVMGLHNRGFRGIDILLMPFSRRPDREVLFQHRPYQFEGADPRSLAALSGGTVIPHQEYRSIVGNYDYFLVCGSNLIESDFANSGKILNVHSGLIPSARGLDSFKWAILNHTPLGNSLHIIDEHADAGKVVYHLPTPVFLEDDLNTLARRHYDNEIWMLTHFDELLKNPSVQHYEHRPATMRMPITTEGEMVREFPAFLTRFSKHVQH